MGPYSFAAGACSLPPKVREEIACDVREWNGSGLSALELPFTGPAFNAILHRAESDLRSLLSLPVPYKVLFLQGGASAQFALLPLNLAGVGDHCDYVESGYWSRRAIDEAAACCDVRVVAKGSSAALPGLDAWRRSEDAAYCHFTSNESADGLQFHEFPVPTSVPLIADMTGDFLTRPLPVERFGLVYSSAQKNLGAAGLTIVIVREDLLDRDRRTGIPAPFDLARQAAAGSKVNTPPTFSILVAARMLRWLVETGGLNAAEERCRKRSAKVYETIDRSGGFYHCPVTPNDRSAVTVCFQLPETRLEEAFLSEAEDNGLLYLRGHARMGGLRAALYNPTPEAAVEALVDFMSDFQKRRG
jgi:phosphoserine aminotransferase